MNYCVLIPYLQTQLNAVNSPNNFLKNISHTHTHTHTHTHLYLIQPVSKDSLLPHFLSGCLFSCLISLGGIVRTALNSSSERGHLGLFMMLWETHSYVHYLISVVFWGRCPYQIEEIPLYSRFSKSFYYRTVLNLGIHLFCKY